MLYVVELTMAKQNYTERMNEMRTWLDHHHVEPSRFRFLVGDASVGCRAHFAAEHDAAAFAAAFGGEVSTVAGLTDGAAGVSSHSASSSEPDHDRPN